VRTDAHDLACLPRMNFSNALAYRPDSAVYPLDNPLAVFAGIIAVHPVLGKGRLP
jgi:hypothetical protein